MSSAPGQAFDDLRQSLHEVTRVVRQRWRLSTIGLAVVGAAAFWISQYLPREYTASSLFERRDDVVLQNIIQGNSPYSFERLKSTMSLDMVGSRALLRGVISIGLLPRETLTSPGALSDAERASLESVLKQYELRADVRLVHSSSTLDQILLRCAGNDPQVVRALVVALRDNYIAESRERMHEILGSTRSFFAGEVERLRGELARRESELRSGYDEFPGLDPTDIVGVGNRLELLRAQRDSYFQRKAALEAEAAAREQFLQTAAAREAEFVQKYSPAPTSSPAGGVSDAVVDEAVRAVKRELVELVTVRRMTMEHPQVRALQDRLDALESLRTALAETAPVESPPERPGPPPGSEVLAQWQAQQMRVELELDATRKQLTVVSRQFDEAEERLARFESLYEQLVAKDDTFRDVLDRRAQLSQELAVWQSHLSGLERIMTAETGERGTQFALIEEPEDVTQPTRPRVASVFAVCSSMGLAAAVLLAALAELLDRSFRSVNQVARSLGVPVLACIGVAPTPTQRRRALRARLFWTPTLSLLVIALLASASLAYTSLRWPHVHRAALERVAGALQHAGVSGLFPVSPPTGEVPPP